MSSDRAQKSWWIGHSTDIGAARRYGLQMSRSLGFDEAASGRVSLIITEAAGNVLKHAHEGRLFLTPVREGETSGIEILAIDKGPGISDLAHSLSDGVTTTGTPGNGLGALRRLMARDLQGLYGSLEEELTIQQRLLASEDLQEGRQPAPAQQQHQERQQHQQQDDVAGLQEPPGFVHWRLPGRAAIRSTVPHIYTVQCNSSPVVDPDGN